MYNTASLDAVNDAAKEALDKIKEKSAGIPQQLQQVRQLYRDNQQAADNVKTALKECKDISCANFELGY